VDYGLGGIMGVETSEAEGEGYNRGDVNEEGVG